MLRVLHEPQCVDRKIAGLIHFDRKHVRIRSHARRHVFDDDVGDALAAVNPHVGSREWTAGKIVDEMNFQ